MREKEIVMVNKFVPGTCVSELVENRSSQARKGEVVSEDEATGTLLVEWQARHQYDKATIVRVAPAVLMLEADALAKESKLDAEFAIVENELKDKLKEASNIIMAANALAALHGESLPELYRVIQPLVSAMDSAGWNTSSWDC